MSRCPNKHVSRLQSMRSIRIEDVKVIGIWKHSLGRTLYPYCSKCGFQTMSIDIMWESVKNENSRAPPQIH